MPKDTHEHTPPELEIARIVGMLRELRTDALDAIKGVSARLVVMEKTSIEMKDSINRMSSEYAETRVRRLEEEAEEAERERELVNQRLKALDEKVEQKKAASVQAIDTNERMKSTATLTFEQEEQKRQKERAAIWRARWNNVITAVMVSVSVPIGLGLAYAALRFLAGVFKIEIP